MYTKDILFLKLSKTAFGWLTYGVCSTFLLLICGENTTHRISSLVDVKTVIIFTLITI